MESLLFPLLLVLLAGFMFFSMRKQKKRAAEMQDMQNSIQTGTRIQLTSGLFGTVIDSASSDYIDVEIATGVVTRWNRLAIMKVVSTEDAAATYAGYVPPSAPLTADGDEFSTIDGSVNYDDASSYDDVDDTDVNLRKDQGPSSPDSEK